MMLQASNRVERLAVAHTLLEHSIDYLHKAEQSLWFKLDELCRPYLPRRFIQRSVLSLTPLLFVMFVSVMWGFLKLPTL